MQHFARLALVASALVASVTARSAHDHHRHLHEKKHATTVESSWAPEPTANDTECGCYTYTTTFDLGPWGLVPEPTPSASSAVPTTSSVVVVPTSSSAPPPPPPASTSSAKAYSAPPPASSSAAPAPAYSAPPQHQQSPDHGPGHNGPSSSSPIDSNGNQWAMTYTPYDSNGGCKSASDVDSDIANIKKKGFTTVRIYATDCSGPQNVGAACANHQMKMIVGIYIDSAGIGSKTDEQIDTLTSWGQGKWDMVEMVVAGNEAIFNNYCSAQQMADFLQHVRSKFRAAGYNGPVTTTEPLGTIQTNSGTICPAVDVIAANIHPFFNSDISAENAGTFVASSLGDLSKCCNGEKEAYNLETGWPSQSIGGLTNGLAIPGMSDQKTAVEQIMKHAGGKSAIFSYENDGWKAPGALGVEQYWGCSNLFPDHD